MIQESSLITCPSSSLALHVRDLSDFEIIFDSTKRLNELNLPNCGASSLAFEGPQIESFTNLSSL